MDSEGVEEVLPELPFDEAIRSLVSFAFSCVRIDAGIHFFDLFLGQVVKAVPLGEKIIDQLVEPFADGFVGGLIRAGEVSRANLFPFFVFLDFRKIGEFHPVVGEADGEDMLRLLLAEGGLKSFRNALKTLEGSPFLMRYPNWEACLGKANVRRALRSSLFPMAESCWSIFQAGWRLTSFR